MRRPMVLCVVLAPALASAQGVLPLSGNYRFASADVETQGGSCAPLSPMPLASVGGGQVAFTPGGTLSGLGSDMLICGNGTASVVPNPITGSYQVGTDGVMTVYDPQVPTGQDVIGLTADGSLFLLGRSDNNSSDASVGFAAALSHGRSNASLNGTYRFVRLLQRNPGNAYVVIGESGTVAFDGNGGLVETSTLRHTVPYNGTGSTATAPLTTNGVYSVANDGSLTTSANTSGALTANGELFFLERHAAPDVEFTVGVRQGPTSAAALGGDWLVGTMASDVGLGAVSAGGPFGSTLWGTLQLTVQGAGAGVVAGQLEQVRTTPMGNFDNTLPVSDAFAFTPATGAVSLLTGAGPSFQGAVSPSGRVLVALHTDPSGVGLLLGLSRCAWPTGYGVPTPGSGGVSPMLLDVGGFPYLGNDGFGLVLVAGYGGAPAGLVFAGARSPLPGGLPLLGGLVWLDQNTILFSQSLVLSGPAGAAGTGAAGLRMRLPSAPNFAGLQLQAQGFVFDPGAPQGVAMTAGLGFRVCR